MHPELFKLPDNFFIPFLSGFSIAWYGVLITMGVLIGAWLANRMAARRGLNTDLLSDMIFFSVLWGVVGARVLYVATSFSQFRLVNGDFVDWLIRVVNIREGGLSIHGGLLFGIGALIYYQRRYKINFYQYSDLFVPGVALGIIGGRLGNFFNGADTIGRFTNTGVGFTWPGFGDNILGIFNAQRNWSGMVGMCKLPDGNAAVTLSCINPEDYFRGPVHLTQIYGVFIGVGLTVACFYWLRSRRPGWAFWQFVLWYSVLRAGIEETFRLNPLTVRLWVDTNLGIGLLTFTQIISIPLIAIAIWQLQRIKKQPEQPWGEGVPVPVTKPLSPLVSSAKAK